MSVFLPHFALTLAGMALAAWAAWQVSRDRTENAWSRRTSTQRTELAAARLRIQALTQQLDTTRRSVHIYNLAATARREDTP